MCLLFAVLFQHIAFVVGDKQGGERKGDDETDETEQAAPNGEGQEDDGRIETCDFAHDAGCENPVLDGLHHTEHDEGGKDDSPKAFSCVVGFQHRQHERGDEAHDLQIRHEVEETDEKPEGNGQGEVDDEEADAEQNTDAHGNEGLPTEVAIHAILEVGHDASHNATFGWWHQLEESFCHQFVIDQDEKEVDDGNEGGYDTDNGTDTAADEGNELYNLFLRNPCQVLNGQGLDNLVDVDVVLDEALHFGRNGSDGGVGGGVFNDDVLEVSYFFKDRRNDEIADTCQDADNEQQGENDARNARLDTTPILDEVYDGIEQIGDEPCYKKGNQHAAEAVDEKIHHAQNDDACQNAHEAVEGNRFCFHVVQLCGCRVIPLNLCTKIHKNLCFMGL